MKVHNPTSEKVTVQISGVQYSVEAGETLSGVPQAAAEYWKSMLHNFISLSEEAQAPVEVVEPKKDVVQPQDDGQKEAVEEDEAKEEVIVPVAKKGKK